LHSSGKPPVNRPNIPRPPHKSSARGKPKEELEEGFLAHAQKQFDPKSKEFLLAFANSYLSEKKRTYSLRMSAAALFLTWVGNTWIVPWNDNYFFTSEEENMANMVSEAQRLMSDTGR
jgi:hypothetical protein